MGDGNGNTLRNSFGNEFLVSPQLALDLSWSCISQLMQLQLHPRNLDTPEKYRFLRVFSTGFGQTSLAGQI